MLESDFDVVGTVTDGRMLLEEFWQLRLKTGAELVQFAVQGVVA